MRTSMIRCDNCAKTVEHSGVALPNGWVQVCGEVVGLGNSYKDACSIECAVLVAEAAEGTIIELRWKG